MANEAFSSGWDSGQRMVETTEQRQLDRRKQAADETRFKAAQKLDQDKFALDEKKWTEGELDRDVERRRLTAAAESLEFEHRLKKDELQRYTEAEASFQQFTKEQRELQWGTDPLASSKYQNLIERYAPGVNMHPDVARKWNALDAAIKQNQVMVGKKVTEQGVAGATGMAAKYAPWLNLNPPKNPDGTVNTEEFATKLQQAIEDAVTRRAKA